MTFAYHSFLYLYEVLNPLYSQEGCTIFCIVQYERRQVKKVTKWRTLIKSMGTPASSARPLFRNRSYATSGLVLEHSNFFNCKILPFWVIKPMDPTRIRPGSALTRIHNNGIYSTQISAGTEQAQLRTREIKCNNSGDIKWCQIKYPGHQDTQTWRIRNPINIKKKKDKDMQKACLYITFCQVKTG